MTLLAQRIFDAMANGAVYASLAVALTMVFRASGILNLAQGEMAMFSSYIAALLRSDFVDPASGDLSSRPFFGSGLFSALGTPWPVWASILGAMVFGAVLGAVVQRFVIAPIDGVDPLPAVGALLGLFLLFRGLAIKWWGGTLRAVGSPFPNTIDDRFDLLGARLRFETIGIVATLLAVLVLLGLVQSRTKIGLAFRALISNRTSAELVGIRVGAVLMVGWAIASALGALGGSLIASQLRVGPNMMARLLVFALAAAILGGLGNPVGAVVGGFAFALLETLLVGYVSFISADVALVYTLGILILVLVIRPGGIFGTQATVKVDRV
ncbi:MAG: branched-chain amino acid transport system permease protein [Acidimicrobiales bacterium]